MKHRLIVAFLTSLLSLQIGSSPNGAQAEEKKQELLRVTFRIAGTDCQQCLNRIRAKIEKIPGVAKVIVWMWTPNYGVVIYNPKQVTWQQIEQSIADEHVQFVDLQQVKYDGSPIGGQ